MAISRMQQPRQNYGLGSFVKKLTRKVTKPFTKVARKIVPKEIAGIMRIAAPFMGPVAGPLAYLAGTAKQTDIFSRGTNKTPEGNYSGAVQCMPDYTNQLHGRSQSSITTKRAQKSPHKQH